MLPRERFGLSELLRWLKQTQCSNEQSSRSHAERRSALRASRISRLELPLQDWVPKWGTRTRLWAVPGAGRAPRFTWCATPRGKPIWLPSPGDGPRMPHIRFPCCGYRGRSRDSHKSCDSNRIPSYIRSRGAAAVIPPRANRRAPREFDRGLYRERNLVERAFNKLKHWRRTATLS